LIGGIAPGAERRRVPEGDGFRKRNPPARSRRLAFLLLPAFKPARRGHPQKNPQHVLRVF
jgi:hypothetical protein